MYFSDTGAHCAAEYCNIHDFLPFKCSLCEKTFCKDHFSPNDHDCPKKNSKDRRVIECPICFNVLEIKYEEKPDVLWQQHQDSGLCKPREPTKTLTCEVFACKTKLTLVNKFHCTRCEAKVCMKHRLPEDHDCEKRKRNLKNERRMHLTRMWKPKSAPKATTMVTSSQSKSTKNGVTICTKKQNY